MKSLIKISGGDVPRFVLKAPARKAFVKEIIIILIISTIIIINIDFQEPFNILSMCIVSLSNSVIE